jgi:energy-converting hydrogenase Eha subunit H
MLVTWEPGMRERHIFLATMKTGLREYDCPVPLDKRTKTTRVESLSGLSVRRIMGACCGLATVGIMFSNLD